MPLILFSILILVSHCCLGIEVSTQDKQVIDDFELFIDSNNQYDPESALRAPPDKWLKSSQSAINLGYTQSTIWVRFTLTNSSNSPIQRLLDINYPLLDYVNLYRVLPSQQTQSLMTSGDSLPFTDRNFSHPSFVNTLTLPGNSQESFLIKVQSNAPVQTELILWSTNGFQKHYRLQSSINFFYLGLILSCAAFNFLVFVFIRENVYLVYALYASSFAFLVTTQHAILFEYLYPFSPYLHNWSQIFLANTTVALTAFFNLMYLRLKPLTWSYDLLGAFIALPSIILLASTTLDFQTALKLTIYSAILVIPACFFIGVFNVKRNADGKFFLTAWTCLFSSVIIFIGAKLGVIPFNQITNSAIQIGSALELLVFGTALARRIHVEKESRIQAQQLSLQDSKEISKLHRDIIYKTTHNPVTGLPDRSYLEQWLNLFFKNTPLESTLVLLRLSRLQEIDKTLGRDISNETLEAFGMRLNSEVQAMDNIEIIEMKENFYVATLGTSTHAFLIGRRDDEQFSLQLKQLMDTINRPLSIESMEIDPYVHCAYARYPENGDHADELIRHASIALDRAQKTGKQIVKYQATDNPYNERRLTLMSELKRAIGQNALSLHYQPLVNTQDGKYIGAEALIRWPHEEHGLLMPDEFVRIAEKTGVIQALSLWVVKTSITQLKEWVKTNPDFLLSVNISALNLQDNKFIAGVNILLKENLDLANNMVLEITESQMMTDTQHALKNLWHLSEMGFHIAIDDFGTGYSNLAYLKKLPASELKIDKAFILNLESDKENQMLVQTAIQMAHNLGLKVVAEGVESEHTKEILEKMGCDICQGYHFSRPLSAQHFNKLFEENSAV
jgi:EAL domain-containing protein (putative c-di-GMP-specific phosphodiesterase class I)/GGDEF domain-containing protein